MHGRSRVTTGGFPCEFGRGEAGRVPKEYGRREGRGGKGILRDMDRCVYGRHVAYVSVGVTWFVLDEFRKRWICCFCLEVGGKKLVSGFCFCCELYQKRSKFWYVRFWVLFLVLFWRF